MDVITQLYMIISCIKSRPEILSNIRVFIAVKQSIVVAVSRAIARR